MKTIDDYMALPYPMEMVEDQDEGGFVVSLPDLPGCISVGDTAEHALANANNAKREWLMAAMEDGYEIPRPSTVDSITDSLRGVLKNQPTDVDAKEVRTAKYHLEESQIGM